MKIIIYQLAALVLLYTNLKAQSFVNVSPKDNSQLVSLSTNIILKSDNYIDASSLSQSKFSVSGSISGKHSGTVKLSDDNKTILFKPAIQFSPNEDVTVQIAAGIISTDGSTLPAITIHFKTTPLAQPIRIDPFTLIDKVPQDKQDNAVQSIRLMTKVQSTQSLPSDFPSISIGASNNPSDGKLFLSNFSTLTGDTIGNYLMILNNDGSVAKYKKLSQEALDFKVLPSGQLSYTNIIKNRGGYAETKWIVSDTSLTPVDTFQCGNGYTADFHDFILLPNGHAIMEAYDAESVDMSKIVPGGDPNATVLGDVIQEVDADGNVVFQWRTWDYVPITDSYIDLTTSTVDLIHANAFSVDADGNIIFSMRHLSTIVKINRQTGNIDWILGGKQNQFTFLNENQANAPTYFSFQHNVQVQPNGNITLFDNGNQHSPNYSRAAEYKLDEVNKTADLVWEYRHTPDIYSLAMGSVQKLADGNTLIGWGIASSTGSPVLTEIKPDKSTSLELSMQKGQVSYRSYKFPWVSGVPGASVTIDEILQGNTYKFNKLNDTTGITIKFDQINSALYPNSTVARYNYSPKKPVFTGSAPIIVSNYFNIKGTGFNSYKAEVTVNLYDYPAVTNPQSTIIYVRQDTSKAFTALATSYDSTKGQLNFTTTTPGDFAFAIPQLVDSSYSPVPLSPRDSEIVSESDPVKLVWGTRGVVQAYHLQVSTDPSFSNLVVDNSNLVSTSYILNSVNNNSAYYWRVSNTNLAGTSSWSMPELFNTAPHFITILTPKGGENLYADSSYVIRWQSNVCDTLNITLLDGNNIAAVIGDSIVSGTGAFKWQVPINTKHGTAYKIMVASIKSGGVSDLSKADFTITSAVTAVNNTKNIVKSFKLSQNYPNPFNPSTVINYAIPEDSRVRIEVFNAIGQRVSTLVNTIQKSGEYTLSFNAAQLASGIYFYSIHAAANSGSNFFSVKKMILLK